MASYVKRNIRLTLCFWVLLWLIQQGHHSLLDLSYMMKLMFLFIEFFTHYHYLFSFRQPYLAMETMVQTRTNPILAQIKQIPLVLLLYILVHLSLALNLIQAGQLFLFFILSQFVTYLVKPSWAYLIGFLIYSCLNLLI